MTDDLRSTAEQAAVNELLAQIAMLQQRCVNYAIRCDALVKENNNLKGVLETIEVNKKNEPSSSTEPAPDM